MMKIDKLADRFAFFVEDALKKSKFRLQFVLF